MFPLNNALRVACVFLIVAAVPVVAQAAGEPVERVTSLNRKAIDAYNKKDYDTAQALLKEALDLCNNNGMDRHPIKARTHIHLGIVSIVGFKQRDRGIKHFRKALEIQPDIKLTKTMVTPELQEAFEEAMLAGGGGDSAGAAAAPAEGEPEGGAAAAGGGEPAAGGDEEATPRLTRRRPKKPSTEEDGAGGEDDDDGASSGGYRFYVALAAGTGAGIASGNGELNSAHTLKSAGFAMAQAAQVVPEVGYFLNPRLLLSARLRLQFVSGLTEQAATGNECGADRLCQPGTTAFAAFVRASYFLGTGNLRWLVGVEVGGGNIRHAQVFPNDTTCGPMGHVQCVDTLASGPFFFGPAFGLLWDFNSTVGLIANVVLDVGVPKFTANFDFNGGLALHF